MIGAVAASRRRSSGGAPLAPATVATLNAWWRADSLSLANADPVASWADGSTNSYDATQATGAAQPTFRTNVVNGLPVVRFDGSDWLAANARTDLAAMTLFFVAKPVAIGGNQTIRGATAAQAMQVCFNGDVGGNPRMSKQASATIATASTGPSTSVFQIYSMSYADATTYAFWRNGAANGSGSHSQTMGGAGAVTNLGRAGSGSGFEYFTGDVAEVIVYSSVLGSTDRGTVTSYLGMKYGITVT